MSLLSTIGSILFIAVGGAIAGYGGAWLMVRKKFRKLEATVPPLEDIKNHIDYNDGKEVQYYGRNEKKSGDSGSSDTGTTSAITESRTTDSSTSSGTTESNSGGEPTREINGGIDKGVDKGVDNGIGEPTTGEPDIEGSTDDSINEGGSGEEGDLPIQSVDGDGESDTSDDSSERDAEEDWPEFE